MFNQNELIEKKIDGTLSSEEEERFEHLLRVDPGFAEAYAAQRSMIDLFRQHQKEALHQRLEAGYQAYQRRRTTRRYYFGAATVVLILIAVGGWWAWPGSSERLFTTYYHPYEVVIARGSAAEHSAIIYYSQGQYTEALPLLEALQQTDENPDYWTLLRGNVYLQVDSTAQAIAQFEQLLTSSNPTYQQYARWYAALGHLKAGDIATARRILQPIASQPGLFQGNAQQLLDQL